MTSDQAVGYKMKTTTALTDLVSVRIYHGNIPAKYATAQTVVFPAINFFGLPGDPIVDKTNGEYERRLYQISVRAGSLKAAKQIADEVEITWHNLQESVNGFDIQFSKVVFSGGHLYEPESKVYHIPITVRLIFRADET